MKKILFVVLFMFSAFVGGCFNLDKYSDLKNGSGGVPTSIVNTTGNGTSDNNLSLLYNNAKKAVVTVLNYASYYDRGKVTTSLYGSGSGFIYSCDDDYIFLYTNAHVVSVSTGYNQSYYEIVFYDGFRSYGELSYMDSSEDVAIMKVKRSNQDFSIAFLGNSDVLNPGESVFAIGSPLGLEYANTITSGVVSNVKVAMDADDDNDGTSTTMYLLQIDAALNPGNSGGPLFNMKGEVVGVNTLKLMSDSSGDDVESFNFCIPINHFVVVANSLAEKGSYRRPLLGVTVVGIEKMTLSDRENYGISVNKGIYIESVSSSGASNDILKKGMVITKINDVVISNLADFSCELYKYYVGETIDVETTNVDGRNVANYTIVLG